MSTKTARRAKYGTETLLMGTQPKAKSLQLLTHLNLIYKHINLNVWSAWL